MSSKDPYHNIAAQAAANPADYKLCAVCGCVVEMSATMCHYCNAYNFILDPERVANVAIEHAWRKSEAILFIEDVARD